jgi:hypothetical protein
MADEELKARINRIAEGLTTRWDYRPVAEGIVEMARRHLPGDTPVALGCALCHKESWCRIIFGCDWGDGSNHGKDWVHNPPFCQILVTNDRVDRLIANYYKPPVGLGANGVGLTQLTTMTLVEDAHKREGGAAHPPNQLHVGFEYLAGLIELYGVRDGLAAYNGGPGNRFNTIPQAYAEDVIAKRNWWQNRLWP